jgi:4-amino-4-deoxy-L-arabinose transferase-like glycosyltransferase
LTSVAVVVVLVAAACAFGMRLLRPTGGLEFASFIERAVFGAALGLGAAAYLVLALGLAHWLYPWAIVAALAALAAVSWREVGQLALGVGRGLRGFFSQAASIGGIATTAFVLAVIVLAVLGALAPSSQNDWDGLSYHLAVPKIYLQHHAVAFLGWMSHSNFPFTLEMLYTAGLALGGQGAAKLFHTLSAALVVLAMVAFGGAHWKRRHGALAAVVLLSAPVVAWEATVAFNDIAAALFTLLSLYALINWWSERGERWLQVSAVMCGFALGVKMNALVLLAFLVVAAFYHRTATQREGFAAGMRAGAWLLVVAAVVASPWYVKSYLWTGNPVYPFFYNLFDGRYWTAEAARLYRDEQLSFGMGRGPLQALLAPWNLTMYGAQFSNFPLRPLIYNTIGPLFIAFLPGLAFLGRLERRVKFLLLYSAAALCAWFYLSQHMRYLIPALPAVALCSGYAAGEILRQARKELRWPAMVAIVLVCVLSLATLAFLVSDALPVALGMETREAYLTRTLDGLYAMARVVNSLPSGSKVIMYGETRGFYFDTAYMWGDPGHHNMIAYDRLAGPAQLVDRYKALEVTHVLMTTQFLRAVQARENKLANLLADAMDRKDLVVVAQRGNLILMRVRERDA